MKGIALFPWFLSEAAAGITQTISGSFEWSIGIIFVKLWIQELFAT